jgi:hypothetical protein
MDFKKIIAYVAIIGVGIVIYNEYTKARKELKTPIIK